MPVCLLYEECFQSTHRLTRCYVDLDLLYAGFSRLVVKMVKTWTVLRLDVKTNE